MRKGTVSLSWHGWRGFGVDRDVAEIMVFVRIGVVSLGASRQVLSDQLHRLQIALRKLRGDQR